MIICDDHKFVFISTTKTGSSTIRKVLKKYHSGYSGYKHQPLISVREKYPFIQNYLKFAFVRNPYDWVVSWFFYRKRKNNINNTRGIDFKNWLSDENSTAYNEKGLGLNVSQFDFIQGSHDCKLDFIGRFENLQEDFNIICDKIKIPQQNLPHKNKSKHKHYTEYYDEETKSIVAEKYAKDIEYFGYKFGE